MCIYIYIYTLYNYYIRVYICMYVYIYIYIYILAYTTYIYIYIWLLLADPRDPVLSRPIVLDDIMLGTALLSWEKGEVLLRGVGTLGYLLILSEDSACQVPICAVAAWWFDNPHQKVIPRSRIPRSTSHFSFLRCSTPGRDFLHVSSRCLVCLVLAYLFQVLETGSELRGRVIGGRCRGGEQIYIYIDICYTSLSLYLSLSIYIYIYTHVYTNA